MKYFLIAAMAIGIGQGALRGTEPLRSSPELAALLRKAAAYSEKLKGVGFHYYCREKVTEVSSPQAGKRDRKRLVYDYQIVVVGGKIREQRTLLYENGHKRNAKNASLDTRYFQSYYSLWLPVTLLGAEKQPLYRYRLQGVERIQKTCAFVLKIEPKDYTDKSLLYGTAWLECSDASVLSIAIDPESLPRFPEYQKASLEVGGPLQILDIHHYFFKRQGIRFPTLTEFREAYQVPVMANSVMGIRSREMGLYERTHATFAYDHFRFFGVSSEVSQEL